MQFTKLKFRQEYKENATILFLKKMYIFKLNKIHSSPKKKHPKPKNDSNKVHVMP